jgi:hypothetical protein
MRDASLLRRIKKDHREANVAMEKCQGERLENGNGID